MIALLLCAGFGTRMYPLTRDRPKPLLPVAGRPVLDYLMDQLIELPGLTAVHTVTNGRFNHQFERWRETIAPALQDRGIGLYLHNNGIIREEERLGALGDLAFLLERLEIPEGALVAAGDNILLFHLRPVWERFVATKANSVIALAENDTEKLRQSGVPVLDAEGLLQEFHEKPTVPPSSWLCPPFYFLNWEGLVEAAALGSGSVRLDGMGHLIQHLLAKMPVHAEKVHGKRIDIGDLATYLEIEKLLQGKPLRPLSDGSQEREG